MAAVSSVFPSPLAPNDSTGYAPATAVMLKDPRSEAEAGSAAAMV
jgi:hypothetical protein